MKIRTAISVMVFLALSVSVSGQVVTGISSREGMYAAHSVLSQGRWYRLGVTSTGIHKLSYQDLVSMGVSLPAESSKIRVFGNGGKMLAEAAGEPQVDDLLEISVFVEDNGNNLLDESGDYLLFYAQGPEVWTYDTINRYYTHQRHLYSDNTCYFLHVSEEPGLRVEPVTPASAAPDVFIDRSLEFRLHERDSLNLMRTGKLWFGEVFRTQLSYDFDFDIPDLITDDTLVLQISVAARGMDSNFFNITAWGNSYRLYVERINPNINTDIAKLALATVVMSPVAGPPGVNITYDPPEDNATGWLNYIRLNASRRLNFHGGQMAFRNPGAYHSGTAEYKIAGANAACRLWKVSGPAAVKEIAFSIVQDTVLFRWNTDTLHEFVLFDGSDFRTPVFLEQVQNQDLHAAGFPDMLIVSHPDFRVEAERLADFRRANDGLDILVAEPQTIYNEFSSGMQDPAAIRDFMRMLYVRAAGDSLRAPRYLLLFGDGSYDMKNRVQPNTNFIPTYQTWNSTTPTGSFVSDDYFGLLDNGEGSNAAGRVDIGVGRLPVSSVAEAKIIVDKILRYNSPIDLLPPTPDLLPTQISNFDDWQNVLLFIADDEDGNLHLKQAEALQRSVDSLTKILNFEKLYLDAFPQEHNSGGTFYPDVNAALNDRVRRGALLVNYTGHGGEAGLAEERILEIPDIERWSNFYNLPVFITATCEFSRYDNPEHRSAGEYILLNPNGGGVAMMSTTRVAYAHSNMIINTNILKAAFDKKCSHRLGDIIRLGKNLSGTGVYIQNFTLLGDPSMKLAMPDLKVETQSINGDSVGLSIDTIYAGQQVTISGCIKDRYGNVSDDFNGEVHPLVFDKPVRNLTLANDPPMSYVAGFYTQNDLLYKGRASVLAGYFSFTFTLPKDVSFREGNTRISYFAKSLNQTATGYFDSLVVLNNGVTAGGDGQGPEIGLFLNNRGFVSGGITGKDAIFIADLEDADGINFFGTGIGHDIIAVFDDDFSNPVLLNEYFVPELDDSRRGSVVLPLSGLAEGGHRVWLRAWDVLNYPSESELEFIVKTSEDLSMNHLRAYPNPFAQLIRFCLDRNNTTLRQWVSINLYTIDGRLLQSIENQFDGSDGATVCLNWDGKAFNGNAVPSGVYIYHLRITDETGDYRQMRGKVTKIE